MRVELTVVHEGVTYTGGIELAPWRGGKKVAVLSKAGAIPKQVITKPSKAVALLYRGGFFGPERRLGEVSKDLATKGFNFSKQSILMALKAADFLAVRGQRGDYRFVQKFPPPA